MKAIHLTELNRAVSLTEVPEPVIKADEVRVRLRAAALNHRDVFIQRGRYPGIVLPIILGSDGAGLVDLVGDAGDPSLLGKAVLLNPALNWGNNPHFYSPSFRILGMPDNGTFAEYVAVPATNVYPKPAHLSFGEAAALPLAGLTAWRALFTRARLKAGEKVLITGIGGGVALFALQFALAVGCEVWVTSGSDEKLERAQSLGAAGGVNYNDPDWYNNLMRQTGGGKTGYFDVTIDSAAGPGFARLTDTAVAGGRIVIFGGTTGAISNVVPSKVFFKQLNILGTTMGSDAEFAQMIHFVEQHGIKPIIDDVFDLSSTEQALRKLENGQQFGKLTLSI